MLSLDSGLPVILPDEVSLPQDKTICISGHREKSIRPYKGMSVYQPITTAAVRLMLYRYIDMAAAHGYEWFISGLATGTDLWAAEYILKKKANNGNIHLVGAMPYLRHSERFPADSKKLLKEVENGCDVLICVAPDPSIVYNKGAGKNLYRDRNFFMVDRSLAVIAFLNEGEGFSGTQQTVNYAYRFGKVICRFSMDDVYHLMDEHGIDIRLLSREITFMDNVFDMPF